VLKQFLANTRLAKMINPMMMFVLVILKNITTNAPRAAAVRVLADFIFAFRFHFSSHNHFPYLQTPHCRLPAC
jgi:hypothetical protein